METLNYIREYAAGFRMPNLSKLWYGKGEGDEVDSGSNKPILIQIEPYLIRFQELALWTDPKSSAIAIGVAHLFFAYLATTSNTTLNLAIWTLLAGFLYITWTQRIWPEIRVDSGKDTKVVPQLEHKNPEVFSASELQDIIIVISGKSKRLYKYLVEMRQETPGKFCFLCCPCFVIAAYIGSSISAFCLFYYLTVGGLVIPGLLRYVIRNYPQAQEVFVNLRIMEEVKLKATKDSTFDEVDSASGSGIVDVRCAADKMQSIVQNVCSTLHTGVTSLASNLPDLQQLEMQQKQLKEETMELPLGEDEDGATLSDDLAPYLPEVNSIESSQILETCVRDIELESKDPTQADSFENDDAHTSMLECSLAGLDRSIMPDHDELDSLPITYLDTNLPSSTGTSSIKYDDFDEANREFLPAKTSEQVQTSNVSNDGFDIEDDSRQLSIDQSFGDSHQSDIGEDSIPYDNNEVEVRAAMEELIDEEQTEMFVIDNGKAGIETNRTNVDRTNVSNVEEDMAHKSTHDVLHDSTHAIKQDSPDDHLEEDFELISAEELSLEDEY